MTTTKGQDEDAGQKEEIEKSEREEGYQRENSLRVMIKRRSF